MVEGTIPLGLGDAIFSREALLDARDALADADLGLPGLDGRKLILQVLACRQVIGMYMGLEDVGDGVALLDDQGDKAVGRLGGDEVLGWIIVKDRVDDDGRLGSGVGNDVLPGACAGLEDIVDNGLGHFELC